MDEALRQAEREGDEIRITVERERAGLCPSCGAPVSDACSSPAKRALTARGSASEKRAGQTLQIDRRWSTIVTAGRARARRLTSADEDNGRGMQGDTVTEQDVTARCATGDEIRREIAARAKRASESPEAQRKQRNADAQRAYSEVRDPLVAGLIAHGYRYGPWSGPRPTGGTVLAEWAEEPEPRRPGSLYVPPSRGGRLTRLDDGTLLEWTGGDRDETVWATREAALRDALVFARSCPISVDDAFRHFRETSLEERERVGAHLQYEAVLLDAGVSIPDYVEGAREARWAKERESQRAKEEAQRAKLAAEAARAKAVQEWRWAVARRNFAVSRLTAPQGRLLNEIQAAGADGLTLTGRQRKSADALAAAGLVTVADGVARFVAPPPEPQA